MNTVAEKAQTPPYSSFKTFITYLNDTKEKGHVPSRVDRSELPKLSGSAANETIATLKYFGLISVDKAEPTPLFTEVVEADADGRKALFQKIVRTAYHFLFNSPGFHIERATAQQVSELFRQQGVNGSTLTRAMNLFLSTVKEAGVKVSPSIRPPKSPTSTKAKKERRAEAMVTPAVQQAEAPAAPGVHRFELPIPGKPSVQVFVPQSLDGEDWEMLSKMFELYVVRWKAYRPPAAAASADDGNGSE